MSTIAEPPVRRRLIDLAGACTTPLLPDEYLTVFNELWSLHDLRGRIEELVPRPGGARTIVIRPGRQWPGHEAGQHLAVGVDVDGVRHWRSYSLTSDPARTDGCIAITVKAVDGGRVSNHLVHDARRGEIVRLGPPEGDFTLSAAAARPLMFVTAGSGITPVMAMLRVLDRSGRIEDVVHIHCDRTADDVIFAAEMRSLAGGYRLHERHTGTDGRLTAGDLDALCPDWRDRDTFACGPAGLLDLLENEFGTAGVSDRLHAERFQIALIEANPGDGGTVSIDGAEVAVEPGAPILIAAEEAGVALESGCRMGICHRCVCRLDSGQVRDLRTGELISEPGDDVQICVTGAAGHSQLSPKN